jgi:DNA-binding transcriptional ArsR family regulator
METERLAATFAALADPTRLTILARLARGEAPVSELAEPLPVSLPAVSRHLKVLETAGLITRGRDAQWRPCRIDVGPLREVADWMAPYKALWEARLDRLGEHLRTMQSNTARRRRPARRNARSKHR